MTKELEKEIEETKKLLEQAVEETEEPVVEEVEEEAEESAEEPEAEEVEEKADPVEEEKTEEKLDDAAYARLRRENAALKKQLESKTPKAEEVVEAEEVKEDPILAVIKERELLNQAGREFAQMENEFRIKNPEYDNIANQYKAAMYQLIRIDNPRESHEVLLEKTNKALLLKAAKYERGGLNPIEELFSDAKAAGFKFVETKEAEPEEEKKVLKPDLTKVAANKKRNAGTAGAKGAGDRGQMTPQALAELPAYEFAKIPSEERQRIMASIRG